MICFAETSLYEALVEGGSSVRRLPWTREVAVEMVRNGQILDMF